MLILPGSHGGNDTRYDTLAARFNLRHISLAALLRKASSDKTYYHAESVKRFLEGEPNDLPVSLVVSLLERSILEGNNTKRWCLVSGFPQSKEQLEEFEKVSCPFI